MVYLCDMYIYMAMCAVRDCVWYECVCVAVYVCLNVVFMCCENVAECAGV